jgi:hypothetical protein
MSEKGGTAPCEPQCRGRPIGIGRNIAPGLLKSAMGCDPANDGLEIECIGCQIGPGPLQTYLEIGLIRIIRGSVTPVEPLTGIPLAIIDHPPYFRFATESQRCIYVSSDLVSDTVRYTENNGDYADSENPGL